MPCPLLPPGGFPTHSQNQGSLSPSLTSHSPLLSVSVSHPSTSSANLFSSSLSTFAAPSIGLVLNKGPLEETKSQNPGGGTTSRNAAPKGLGSDLQSARGHRASHPRGPLRSWEERSYRNVTCSRDSCLHHPQALCHSPPLLPDFPPPLNAKIFASQ